MEHGDGRGSGTDSYSTLLEGNTVSYALMEVSPWILAYQCPHTALQSEPRGGKVRDGEVWFGTELIGGCSSLGAL